MAERSDRGAVQRAVLAFLAASDPTLRFTPTKIAAAIDVAQGSVYAACKSLVKQGKVRAFGESPLMIGRR